MALIVHALSRAWEAGASVNDEEGRAMLVARTCATSQTADLKTLPWASPRVQSGRMLIAQWNSCGFAA